MDIEIESKRNNPLLNRTEIHFIVHHKDEGTPNREILRSKLAEKLNVKKENIIINHMRSSFGIQETRGYAKIYSSTEKAKTIERKHILKRNKILGEEKTVEKKAEDITKPKQPEEETKPMETKEQNKRQETAEETKPASTDKKEESSEKQTDKQKISEKKE